MFYYAKLIFIALNNLKNVKYLPTYMQVIEQDCGLLKPTIEAVKVEFRQSIYIDNYHRKGGNLYKIGIGVYNTVQYM